MDREAAARPRFKASLEPVVDADDGLFLLHERGHHWYPGQLAAELGARLDGRHTAAALFATLAERHEPAAVLALLEHWRDAGHLAPDTGTGQRAFDAWWTTSGHAPRAVRTQLAAADVQVLALPASEPQRATVAAAASLPRLAAQAARTLRESGVLRARQRRALGPDRARQSAGPAALTVLLVDDALHPALPAFNLQALQRQHTWMLVKPLGQQPWIGPLFRPGLSGCWQCLAHRLHWHRRVQRHLGRSALAAQPQLPAWSQATVAEACALALHWLAQGEPGALADGLLTREGPGGALRTHLLQRRPQCPACGQAPQGLTAAPPQARPLPLQARALAAQPADGGHRAVPLAQALRRLERHLSPITGLVADVSGGERTAVPGRGDAGLVAVAAADHNFADVAERRFFVREGLRRRSGGKGRSAEQARAGALAEALERYCGVFDGSEPRFAASWRELQAWGLDALQPNEVMGYSERQYRTRARWNRHDHKAFWVPEPFEPEARIEWCALWSLGQARTRYLPASLCWFGHAEPAGRVFARADSNGCAAGAVLEEAVLQGLLELIERDAVALWWYGRLRRPGIALDGRAPAYAQQLSAHYRGLQRELWALDLTSDLGVPCVAALSRRTDQRREDIIYGFGCHLDAEVALSRALTEMNQSLDAVPLAGGGPQAQTHRGSAQSLAWWRRVRLQTEPWLQPHADAPAARGPRLAPADDLQREIDALVQRLGTAGIDVMVLDQTRPDVGLPVVRVVAPGLRHFWARFGAGRLYDVPVQQGWLPRHLDESELNPWVIQF